MNCPKCSNELILDHADENGNYYWTCINKKCPEYRKSYNYSTGTEQSSNIKIKPIKKQQ